LTIFFVTIEPQYRRTFFVRDTRRAMHRRHWKAWAEGMHGDEDRAGHLGSGTFMRYVGEPVVIWIEQRAEDWVQSPPAWCTAEWRAAVIEHAHLLPGDGAARVALAMSCFVENDDDDDATRDEKALLESAGLEAQAEVKWDLGSTLVV
jgi:hypothetical protein